jgi:predicted nucleotidyltransferase
MDDSLSELILRDAGARFAFLFGSRARGTQRVNSDVDIAAYFGASPPHASNILLPSNVDLLILDTAPLELAGRVALEGRLLFEVDPEARIEWLARTRKVYADERYRFERSHREFAAAVRSRG